MVFNVPAGQSRYICWLGNGLTLTAAGSPFNSSGHTVVQLSTTNGAVQSWKNGRSLNSLPNSALVQLGTYQITAGTAAMTLPDYVAGLGGAPDTSLLPLSGSPSPTPPGTTPQGTIAFTQPAANASVAAGSVPIGISYNLTSGAFTNGIAYRFNGGTWTTLVANPSGGTFSGNVTITTAATGSLEVRFADNTSVTASRTITITGGSPGPAPTGTYQYTAGSPVVNTASGSVNEGIKVLWHGSNTNLLNGAHPALNRAGGGNAIFAFPTVNSLQQAEGATANDFIEFSTANTTVDGSNQFAGSYTDCTILIAASSAQGGYFVTAPRDGSNNVAFQIQGQIGGELTSTTGNLAFIFNTGGASDNVIYAPDAATKNEMAIFTVRKTGNRIRIEKNGTQIADETNAAYAGSITPTGVLYLGRTWAFGNGQQITARTFQFWGRSLSDAELTTKRGDFYAGVTGQMPSVVAS